MNADNGEPLFSTFTFGEMDLVKSINITRLTELYTSVFIFSGIGKTIIIEILYWIMVEPEFLIWMM